MFFLNQTIQYVFWSRFATFSDFEKKSGFFSKKKQAFFFKKPKFWTFREFLPFWPHSTASFLPLATFRETLEFFREKTYRILKKHQILKFLRNLTIAVAFYGKSATMWWEPFFRHVSNGFWFAYASSIGKHLVKNWTSFRGRFCFLIF